MNPPPLPVQKRFPWILYWIFFVLIVLLVLVVLGYFGRGRYGAR